MSSPVSKLPSSSAWLLGCLAAAFVALAASIGISLYKTDDVRIGYSKLVAGKLMQKGQPCNSELGADHPADVVETQEWWQPKKWRMTISGLSHECAAELKAFPRPSAIELVLLP